LEAGGAKRQPLWWWRRLFWQLSKGCGYAVAGRYGTGTSPVQTRTAPITSDTPGGGVNSLSQSRRGRSHRPSGPWLQSLCRAYQRPHFRRSFRGRWSVAIAGVTTPSGHGEAAYHRAADHHSIPGRYKQNEKHKDSNCTPPPIQTIQTLCWTSANLTCS